ncbi:hypothetical protein CC80DRAFT_495434 [Byssothecium circinans]|uniref:Uncharacterized protein n=1 Tax=Byssothecium circinans TaxID=147558 RepID=A0A6A5TJQ0_9PLEO|nr:hypothetical protein CC80DRAFT_495434 [Byssothecium circinans]
MRKRQQATTFLPLLSQRQRLRLAVNTPAPKQRLAGSIPILKSSKQTSTPQPTPPPSKMSPSPSTQAPLTAPTKPKSGSR